MSFVRKPLPKRERTPVTRSTLAPSLAVMRRVDAAKSSAPTPHAAPREPAKTQAERDHMGRVAALGCLLCGQQAEVHHIREGQGMAQRASNWLTVPLCPEHHRGNDGLHGLGERGFERRHRKGEMDLLAETIAKLAGGLA